MFCRVMACWTTRCASQRVEGVSYTLRQPHVPAYTGIAAGVREWETRLLRSSVENVTLEAQQSLLSVGTNLWPQNLVILFTRHGRLESPAPRNVYRARAALEFPILRLSDNDNLCGVRKEPGARSQLRGFMIPIPPSKDTAHEMRSSPTQWSPEGQPQCENSHFSFRLWTINSRG